MVISTGSLLFDLLGVLTAILATTYAYFKWSYQYWKKRNFPYLEPVVPLGNFENPYWRKISPSDETVEFYKEAKKRGLKYCGIWNLANPNLLVTDLELLKHILTKDFSHFIDRGFYVNEKADPLSAHLFAIGGAKWRNLRTKLTPTFTSGKMKAMFQTLVDCGLVLDKYLEENITTTTAVDIKDVVARFTTDIIGSCAFGLDCNTFKEPDSPFRVIGKRFFTPTSVDVLKIAFCNNFPKLGKALGIRVIPNEVSEFYSKIAKDTVRYREKNHIVRKDFMQLLIDIKNNKEEQPNGHVADGKSLTMDELAAQSFVFFIAGFETSSTTSTFALFELASNQKIQDKVREEINTVLAKHDNKITYDSLSDMKYMGQVIDETLRKYPPVPFITRQCVEDYRIPGEDAIVEKGVTIFIPIRGIHYDDKYYKNPEEFDPDRFNDENTKKRHQYAHIPFGEGPRICIGARFGIMQTKVGLTCILKRFRVRLHRKTNVPLVMDKNCIIPCTAGDIWLTLEKI